MWFLCVPCCDPLPLFLLKGALFLLRGPSDAVVGHIAAMCENIAADVKVQATAEVSSA